jgi:GntR family transcriptional regulator/MocR family aminotransferase
VLDLAFRPDRSRGEPLARQLEAHLRELVVAGRLAAGEKLPATRELAAALGLGRNTVAAAYEALVADGLLRARVGQGTFVAARAAARRAGPLAVARGFAWEGLFAARTRRVAPPPVALREPDEIVFDFRPGGVDADSAPELELRRAFSRALARHGRALATHRDPFGWPPLREAVARALVARGIGCAAGDVLITNGAQQGLDLLARCLVDPGDAVVLEQPGYFAAAWAFAAAGAHLVGVAVDEQGLRTDELARVLRSRRVKLVYATPAVQSPTGVVLSDARRDELLELADAHQTPVVEDDYDAELRRGGAATPALKAGDAAGQVIYAGTFSKALLPGLRIGYLVAPPAVLRRLALARIAADFGPNTVAQVAIAELLAAGDFERHVRRVRKLYAARLNALHAALAAHLPPGAAFAPPAGGNALWLRLPPAADPDAVWAGMLEAGVAAARGDLFFIDGQGRDCLLLGVAGVAEERIEPGVARLAAAVRRASHPRRRTG